MATSGQILEAAVKAVIDRLWITYLTRMIDFEGGNIPYMYVDTPAAAQVTVGVGHNLTSHLQNGEVEGYLKTEQRFVVKRLKRTAVIGGADGGPIKSITDPKMDATQGEIGRGATPAEIQNDFDFLASHTKLGAATLANKRKYTTVELKDGVGEDLFKLDLSEAIKESINTFGKATFDAFPLSCQAGIIDVAYNPGLSGFSTFVRAIKGEGEFAGKPASERWTKAAKESHRTVTGQSGAMTMRNQTVEKWFTDAATEAKAKEGKVK